ncbi:TonB-dependent receptor, partial [Bacteroides sp. OttesenSCG-928-D19]|nr:TonB-dependent receptor [Bacteroides sp. OttesenSCG-928-D19]
ESDYLKFTHNLKPEMANHFIFNYQFEKNKRVFRTEVYYKKYNDLIKYETLNNLDPNSYNNTGKGFAKGFDLFYRDKRTIPNGDFWISYSFLDTKRNYKNYPMMVTPKYFSKHALSVVYKQWIPLLKSNIGLTYNFMSGRPYYNPNKNYEEYLSDKTRTYNDISMNYALDLSSFTKLPVTLYLSATNLLGEKHIYGYTYSGKDSNGKYDLSPINAMSKRFYTIAILMSFK